MRNRKIKKILKISGITIASLIVALLAAIAFVIHFVVTPEKLTPVVLKVANQSLNAEVDMESVELTFFSTFPRFGVKVKKGTLISKALNDTVAQKQDSLLVFKECVLTVNPVAYLLKERMVVHDLSLKDASVYAYRNKEGVANWDIVKSSADTLQSDTSSVKLESEIEIQRVKLEHTNIVFDDRNTDVYARVEEADLALRLSLTKGISSLGLEFSNKNILFWQQGELLVNKIAVSLQTDIRVDRNTRIWELEKALLDMNGIKLDVNGTFRRDTVTRTIDMDLKYGLHAPSVETVLAMIPKAYVKENKVSAKGAVDVGGTVKGAYGDKKLPVFTLKIGIKDASAKYDGLQYGIDNFTADLDAYVDLMRDTPSFLNLKILHLKGAHTDILAEGKVENLLADPLITFKTESKVDLDALSKTFPLQEGVAIHGKLDARLGVKCRLSSLKKQDFGRIKLGGILDLKGFELKDKAKDFGFTADATLRFRENETLQAQMDIRNLILRSRLLTSEIKQMTAEVSSTNPQDTTRVVSLQCGLKVSKLNLTTSDSIVMYSAATEFKGVLEPSKKDATKPLLDFSMKADSLFLKANGTDIRFGKAGFKVQVEKLTDSLWSPRGAIGFDRLRVKAPEFGLPVRMRKTVLTMVDSVITLKNVALRMGRSNLIASGNVMGLYRAITKGGPLTAHLSVSSEMIDCNQLINALSSLDEISETAETDTVSQMKLFVIPKNINFELKTDIKKVQFDKMVFEKVYGNIDIKNQAVHMKGLSMNAMGAEMKAVMVYKASSSGGGYAGFDFKIHNINVAKLVDFIPSLDTIVPMLRSFKGTVQFDVAADARLDSLMNIRIPTLRSAIHIKGDSLVLMDGETFAEISKMLMFKNKKENVFDSISVNVTVNDGNVTIYPFLLEIDRYKAAVGGKQGLDMNLDYHISILKSPLPFKAGINITGTPDKMKFRIGKAKYKNAVTPVEIHKVDSTRVNVGNQITTRFNRMMAPVRKRHAERKELGK